MSFVLQVTTPAVNPPISLADAKAQLRMQATYDDAYITALLYAAWFKVEQMCRKTFCTTTYTMTLDAFPLYTADMYYGAPMNALQLWFVNRAVYPLFNQLIILPKPPVQSVTSITYTDPDTGSPIVLDPSQYLFVGPQPARLAPQYGLAWPVSRMTPGSIKIVYQAGYCDPGSNPSPATSLIPQQVQQAIRLMVAFYYENRGETNAEPPEAVKALLRSEFLGDYF